MQLSFKLFLLSLSTLFIFGCSSIDVETNGTNAKSKIELDHLGYDTVFQTEIMKHIHSVSSQVSDEILTLDLTVTWVNTKPGEINNNYGTAGGEFEIEGIKLSDPRKFSYSAYASPESSTDANGQVVEYGWLGIWFSLNTNQVLVEPMSLNNQNIFLSGLLEKNRNNNSGKKKISNGIVVDASEERRERELLQKREKAKEKAAKKLAEEKAEEEEEKKRLQMPFDIANAWTKKLKTKGVDDQNVQIRPLRDGVKIVLRQGEKNTLFESSSFELSNFGKSVLQKVCSLIPQGVLEFSVDSHTHKFDASLGGGGNLDSFKLSYAQGKETVKMLDHYLSGKLTKKLQNINSYGSENIEYQRTPSSRKNRRLELSLVLQSHPDPKAGVQKTTSIDIDVLHRIAQDWYERLRLHEIDDSTIQIEATSGGIKITLFHSDTKPLFESLSSELTSYGREVMNKMSWLLSQNVLEFSVDSRAHRFDRIMEEMIDPIEFTYSIVEALNHYSSGELENKLTTIKAYGKSLSKIQEGHNGGRKNHLIELNLTLDLTKDEINKFKDK